jgi:ATP synthase protein I
MQSNDARVIRGAAIPTAAVGVLAVALGAVTTGLDGAVAVGFGVLVAAGFFLVGMLSLSSAGRRWPELMLGSALLIYTTQMGVLLALLLLLRDASFLNGRAFALGVAAGMVAWLGGHVWAHVRQQTPYVEPAPSSAPSDGRP